MIKHEEFYKMIDFYEQAIDQIYQARYGNPEAFEYYLAQLSMNYARNDHRDFEREMEENLLYTILDQPRYFERIYTKGIIPIMAYMQSTISELKTVIEKVPFPEGVQDNQDALLQIVEIYHQYISNTADAIRKEATSLAITSLKEASQLIDVILNEGPDSYFQSRFKMAPPPHQVSVQRPLIFAYIYRSAVHSELPKRTSPKHWKEYAKEINASGYPISEYNMVIKWYTTNEQSKEYNPPKPEEIPIILKHLSGDHKALEYAEKEILKSLEKYPERKEQALEYFRSIDKKSL